MLWLKGRTSSKLRKWLGLYRGARVVIKRLKQCVYDQLFADGVVLRRTARVGLAAFFIADLCSYGTYSGSVR